MITQDLGIATAYGYAKSKGYTGTEAEFAELMASYATVGQTAVTAAQTATTKASEAATSATTATTKASEATTAATTATAKAGEASTSASTATSAKDTAVSASQTATTKATEATTAAATATSAKTDAVAANTAAQSAKTAAQTAQTGAETAAASVQSSAAQIQTNADDISELKEDLTGVDARFKTVIGKNLFDKDDPENLYGTSKSDCYVMDNHGVPFNNTAADANYSVSCFVPVESGRDVYFGFVEGTYKITYAYQVAQYDESKAFISMTTWVPSCKIAANASYIRVSAITLHRNFQIEYDALTSYEPYSATTYLNNVKVNAVDVVGGGEDYLVLPKKFYGVQNKEYDIFFKNVIVGNFNRFIVGKSGTGEQLSRRIKYNVGTAGITNTNLVLYDESYNQIQSTNISYVNTNASAHSGETLKVLVIGDSFINSGYVTKGLIHDFENDVATLQLLGTLGTAPNLHEGRSGWSSYEYTHETAVGSVSNPFLNNGTFDFSHYISANSVAKPDYVIINLGINDGWKDMHGTTTAENLQIMIDSIHAYDTAVKVIVGTTPSPYLGDGENGYLAHLVANRVRQNLTRNVLENLTESETVIISPIHLNFDTDYNFNMSTIAKNGQNSDTVPYCLDDTHPSHTGFYQIADSYYACIKAY